LRNALDNSSPGPQADSNSAMAPTLASDLHRQPAGKIRIIPLD
jgi:hypothetical protein